MTPQGNPFRKNGVSMKPLFIIGSGGMGMEALMLAEDINAVTPKWEIRGYVTGQPEEVGQQRVGYPIVGTDEDVLSSQEPFDLALAVGEPALIRRLAELYRMCAPQAGFPNLVHPQAWVARHDVELGNGNLVCRGATISLPVRIGSYNIVNIGATLHHDVVLGDCNVVGPGAILLGKSRVGDLVFVGAGAVILPGIAIDSGSVVGAGSVVLSDVPANTTVAGVPARALPRQDD